MALLAAAEAGGVEIPEDLLPRLEAVEARVGGAGGRRHLSVEADHGDRLERVPLPRLEVVRVVSGRHLHDARPELRVHEGVGDHGDLAARERQRRALSGEARVPRIVRVHGERRVAEHRLRPRRGDDELAAPDEGIRDRVEVAGALDVVHLEIREHRRAARAPVHHPLGAVGEAVVVQGREDVAHGAGARLVERVVDAREIARRAEAADLVEDVAAPRAGPLAAERDEGFAADVVPGLPRTLLEVALDDHLRRDARVVHAGHPEHGAALHPPPAAEYVLERAPESVPHVQAPRHVRGRNHERVRNGVRPGRLGAEETGLLLGAIPAHLERGGVEGLVELGPRLHRGTRRIARGRGFGEGTPGSLLGLVQLVEALFHEALGELGHDVPRDLAHDALAGELEDPPRDAVDVVIGEGPGRWRGGPSRGLAG